MTENQVKKIQFVYFGFHNEAEPRYFGIDAQFLPGSWVSTAAMANKYADPSDYLAISANHLFGAYTHFASRATTGSFSQTVLFSSPVVISKSFDFTFTDQPSDCRVARCP